MLIARFVFLLLLLVLHLSAADYSIVFIHIGPKLPHHTKTAIEQAHLFNEKGDIILLVSQEALEYAQEELTFDFPVSYVTCESLTPSAEHLLFRQKTENRHHFWLYTSERFLYLDELIEKYHLEKVFHLENDVMLYADLSEYLPIFEAFYPGIAAVFDHDQRCIPSFLYISQSKYMHDVAAFFASNATQNSNDMELLAKFRNSRSTEVIDNLPIILPTYLFKFPFKNSLGHRSKYPQRYVNHFAQFQAVFDAAALGQYLGGIDPCHGHSVPGFINETCLFDPSKLQYTWETDSLGRKVPYAMLWDQKCKIINLHIHCKDLARFSSKE